MRLGVRLLGALEVECAGRVVPIGAAKERLIVVLLALNAGRVVPIERLIDAAWAGDPPDSANTTVRVLVSRLRKTLATGGCREVIDTRHPGYLMAADSVDVDVHRFEALTARGRGQLAAGSAHEAAATLRAALDVWRGDRLAEGDNPRLAGEAARLAEARLATLQTRIDAELACGRHAELVGELEELCHAHRLREPLWAQRMLALYRCGRQADALAAYQQLRTTLADELGLDPSGDLRKLEAAILAQDPALAPPPAERLAPRPLATTRPADIPLPAPLRVSETVACVGRDPQLGELRAVWERALAGEPRMVLVSGEAGVGKTRLVREFARKTHRQGAVVLHGRCDEDVAIPFRPIREFLTHYVASVPHGRLAGHDPHRLGELTRLVPELAQRLPQLPDPTRTDPQAERYVLFAAVAGLLSEIASEMPVILVLDDLHWADRPTLLLLRHLAGAALGQVLVLGTYRDVEAVAGQSLAEAVAALCREPTVGHIRLQGLAESAVAAVMAAMAGGALDAEGRRLARDLAHETDGNAFMVVEHVRHLWRTGVLTRAEDGTATTTSDLASAGLPHTVQQVVAGRLAPLGDAADRVVSVASVIGEQFDLDLLVAATGWDHDRVLEVLEAAGHQALVTEAAGPAGRFRFAHATVRHVIYQRLGPTRQARLHARIGQALEDLCGDEPGERAGELARHFHAGRPAHARKAARYARLAGERALAALAPHEAAGWFSQAIEALQPVSDDAERVRCMVGLGDAQIQAGIPTGRHTLLDAARTARQLGESDLLICAALASNRGMFARTGHVDAELVALLEDALEVCPGSPQRARLLSRLAAELTFHPDPARRRAIADEAVAAAQASGDAAALLDALTRPDTALMIPELSDLRLSRLQEARALADRIDDPAARFWAAYQLTLALFERADPDGVDQALGHAEEIARKLGQPLMRFFVTIARCSQAMLDGHLDVADRLAGEALQIGTANGQPDAAELWGGQLFYIRWHQGRLKDVLAPLNGFAADLPEFLAATASLALAEALDGQPERARRLLHTAADVGFAHRTAGWLTTHCLWAEVAVVLRDHNVACVLYDRLLSSRRLFAASGPFPLHAVAHSLGRLAALNGRVQDADEHFTDALAIHQRMRAPFCIAATQLAWGRLLLPHDPDRARRLLADTATIAAHHGYGYLQRSVHDKEALV